MTSDSALRAMLESIPELAEVYPYSMTIVMDAFANFVADRVREGAA